MSRNEILEEIAHVEKDLRAFKMARDHLTARVTELNDDSERQQTMLDWPAFKVVDNGLIMAIVRCEGLLEDYRKHLGDMELPDNIVPMETQK